MKNTDDLSTKQLPTGQGSVEIIDFLYVDRGRTSALFAQLFPQGVLTSVKTVQQTSFSDTDDLGSDIKILKVESKSTRGGSSGTEHMFDASWSLPLEVLAELKNRKLLADGISLALGSIFQVECVLRIIDFESMRDLWDPATKLHFLTLDEDVRKKLPVDSSTIADLMKAFPKVIHAHYLTRRGYLWSALLPSGLNVPTSDLTLKWGSAVTGIWQVVGVLDAFPDAAEPPDTVEWSGGQLIDGVMGAMHGIRQIAGRPAGWIGITPLMIFRRIGDDSSVDTGSVKD